MLTGRIAVSKSKRIDLLIRANYMESVVRNRNIAFHQIHHICSVKRTVGYPLTVLIIIIIEYVYKVSGCRITSNGEVIPVAERFNRSDAVNTFSRCFVIKIKRIIDVIKIRSSDNHLVRILNITVTLDKPAIFNNTICH